MNMYPNSLNNLFKRLINYLLMKHVKYGIIGCGGAWAFHSAGCKDNPKIKFNSVFDANEKAAKGGKK